MKSEIIPKNGERLADLITYIEKHRHEIIDYELRKPVGKTTGSGRVRKPAIRSSDSGGKRKGLAGEKTEGLNHERLINFRYSYNSGW